MPGGKGTVGSVLRKLVDMANANTRRLRVVEQEIMLLKRRTDTIEGNVLEQRKQNRRLDESFNIKITRLDEKITKLQNMIKEIIKEMKKLATTSKINELEQLVDIYNPLKSQFVTKEEVERLIEERATQEKQ